MKFITIIFVLFLLIINTIGQNISVNNQNFPDTGKIIQNTIKNDSWFAIDKGQHFIGSFIGTILFTKVNNRQLNIDKSNSKKLGIGIIFSLGLAKETLDSQKPNNIFSWRDLLANIAGIATAIAVLEIK